MRWKWPIHIKLLLGLGLLVLAVAILSSTGLVAIYRYRNVVNSLSWRVGELPLAAELSRSVSAVRITLGELRGPPLDAFPESQRNLGGVNLWAVRDRFRSQLDDVDRTLQRYRDQMDSEMQADPRISGHERERETVRKIEDRLAAIREADRNEDWMLNLQKIVWLDVELEQLQDLATELPGHLHTKLAGFANEVRGQYRGLVLTAWAATGSACLVFLLFIGLSYRWIFRPLRILIAGSRRVAAGEFSYRICIDTGDEMAELAKALNDMTIRFQEIRDDLDRQVRERTMQAVRSEQLASVGFLAAGVAHEINNPLASIAMCAESLEGRFGETFDAADPEQTVVADYLRMIQAEAFRCKGITEKLLDFSRLGPGRREHTELGQLVEGVLEMLRHMGKYHQKQIDFAPSAAVVVLVNPQEIKQVVLNLLTNALDSLDEGGTVRVASGVEGGCALLSVSDDGCGMEPAVLEHIFEPFFTRRRGRQGTGLGLSISYRIIADHGGKIEAASDGAGRGSTFRVRLPLAASQKEPRHRRQAA